jgi:hypothetical protein
MAMVLERRPLSRESVTQRFKVEKQTHQRGWEKRGMFQEHKIDEPVTTSKLML